MTNLKRLGRCLKKRPRLVQLFVEQASTTNVVRLDVCGDSDHAVSKLARARQVWFSCVMHIVSKCQVTRVSVMGCQMRSH